VFGGVAADQRTQKRGGKNPADVAESGSILQT
jgi:hypothetical protein